MDIAAALQNPGVEGISLDPVKITRVFDRKSGENAMGEWSFQDLGVESKGQKYYIKLKGLPPAAECGIQPNQVLTFSSTKGAKGMHGVKVTEETYNGKTTTKVLCTPAVCIRQGTATLYGNATGLPAPKAKPAPLQTPNASEIGELTPDQAAYLEANPDDPQLLGYVQAQPETEAPASVTTHAAFDGEAGQFAEAGRRVASVLKAISEEICVPIVDVSAMTDTDPGRLQAIAHQQGEMMKLASTGFISASGGRR